MKRGTRVYNRADVKTGRVFSRWAATGMNWAPGESRDAISAQGRKIAASIDLAAALGRAIRVEPSFDGTQSWTTAMIEAIHGDHRRRVALMQAAGG